jgi:predicted  nucleic acid-binding Zn-ribbon protein
MNKMIMKITKYVKQIKELEKVKNSVSRLEFENGWLRHLHEKSTAELKGLKMKHRDALNELQVITQERNLLKNELSSVHHEMSKLREEMEASKYSFVDFLELKKQVETLEEENRNLSKKSKTYKIKMLKPAEYSSTDTGKQLVPINLKST